jgi:hypothetical protein
VSVPDGGVAVLRDADFDLAPLAQATPRGAVDALRFALGGAYGTGLTRSTAPGGGFALDVELDRPSAAAALRYLVADVVARTTDAGGLVSYREQSLDLRAGVGWVASAGRLRVRLAPELGAAVVRQDHLAGNAGRTAVAPELGGAAALEIGLAGPVAAYGSAFGGGTLLDTVLGAELRPRVDGELGLALRL